MPIKLITVTITAAYHDYIPISIFINDFSNSRKIEKITLTMY